MRGQVTVAIVVSTACPSFKITPNTTILARMIDHVRTFSMFPSFLTMWGHCGPGVLFASLLLSWDSFNVPHAFPIHTDTSALLWRSPCPRTRVSGSSGWLHSYDSINRRILAHRAITIRFCRQLFHFALRAEYRSIARQK